MKYKNPCVTADLIIENNNNEILLILRGKEPFKGMYALPGGHLNYGLETVESAGVRELKEETGLISKIGDLEILGVYSNPNRDPRGHYVTVAYIVKKYSGILEAADDADDAVFFSIDNLPPLAFDHKNIIGDYKKWKIRK
ncbi:NUDIX hydrolase [archaeon]|nr:NUDIX hydrolase [archaeon]